MSHLLLSWPRFLSRYLSTFILPSIMLLIIAVYSSKKSNQAVSIIQCLTGSWPITFYLHEDKIYVFSCFVIFCRNYKKTDLYTNHSSFNIFWFLSFPLFFFLPFQLYILTSVWVLHTPKHWSKYTTHFICCFLSFFLVSFLILPYLSRLVG